MRALLQRVNRAAVMVDGEIIGAIDHGLLALVAVAADDSGAIADQMAFKTANLRIFADDEGHFHRSVLDAGGAVLVVSQFTLYADTRRGRRPSFSQAARPDLAVPVLARYVERLRALGLAVAEGRFAAHMQVELVNDGPVTIWLDSTEAL